ncbi:hypothetical protein F5Y10DRAFT_256733 [Nemania abortiva]|nr:hypothetical protein F5Y10DRAFT_256733 [Nemania abortiva]
MAKEPPGCPPFDVSEWDNKTRGWQDRKPSLHVIPSAKLSKDDSLVSADAKICIIFASANKIRKCKSCRTHFIDEFQMPESWWSDSSRKSNGYFGYHATDQHTNTWAYFETKHLDGGDDYHWDKLNVFIRWNKSTHQTIVLSFDTPKTVVSRFKELLATPDPSTLKFPFWFYPHLLNELARLQERAVWAVRDKVRAVEKKPPPEGRPKPDYRHLHDVARHAIHVSETLDVAAQTIERILRRHKDLMGSTPEDGQQAVHSEIQFFESFISSLRCRSASNDKRMANEIQLAFNTVAQHDASTSVQIGRATQSDSVTMKTIAFVTLAFLPPTFVSAIFSMSFFNYSAESGWAISDKFWLYWAFAVPITVLTVIVWYCYLWQHNGSASPGDGKRRSQGSWYGGIRSFSLQII